MTIDSGPAISRSQVERFSARTIKMLVDYGGTLLVDGSVDCMQVGVEAAGDVHGLYNFTDKYSGVRKVGDRNISDMVVHVQAYPSISTAEKAIVTASVLNKQLLAKLRALGAYTLGEEDNARTSLFYDGQALSIQEYSPEALDEIINEGLLELLGDNS